MREVLAGEAAARERLVERLACVPGILRARGRRMGLKLDEDDLDELVHYTVTAIWSELPRFAGQSALDAWAFGFCLHELYKWRERTGRAGWHVPLERAEDEPASGAEESPADLEALERALAELGPPAAPSIALKHFDELTFEEIGAQLGTSPNTAKTRYCRGFERLRELLRPTWEKGIA